MRRAHLLLGALFLVAFVLTGQYMHRVHNHLEGMADGPRLLYRTRHIFILLTALLHLCLGAYLRVSPERWRKALQAAGSLLVTVAGVLFLIAFFQEPNLQGLETPFSHDAAYAILVGVILHVGSGGGQ